MTNSNPEIIALFSVSLLIKAEQATRYGQYRFSNSDYFWKNELPSI